MRVKLDAESPSLRLICGLRWPKVLRYYLTFEEPGTWHLWEVKPRGKWAWRLVSRVPEKPTSVTRIAMGLLDDYLRTHRRLQLPKGDPVPGLLGAAEIEEVLERHLERGRRKYAEMYATLCSFAAEEGVTPAEMLATGKPPRAKVLSFDRQPRSCPQCAGAEVEEIAYGLPGPELEAEGQYQVGGCVVRSERWHCVACGWEW